MGPEREQLTLDPIADAPEVGRWLAAMQDARRDTLRELEGVQARWWIGASPTS